MNFRTARIAAFGTTLLFLSAAGVANAASVSLSPIYVSIGPDGNTSPSYAAYTANAQAAVAAGQTSLGGNVQTTPSAYNSVGSGSTVAVSGPSITNSPFPSWLGVADPGGALTGQLGNFIYWNIVFTGTDISLSQVTVTQSSNDPLDYFGNPTQPGGLFSENFASYSTDIVGITSTGTKITSGSSSQQVNEIIITQFGAAQSGYGVVTTGATDAQNLQQIDNAFALGLGDYAINTCFYYGSASSANPSQCDATDVTNISTVPEPSSFACVSLGLLLLPMGWLAQRRRARNS